MKRKNKRGRRGDSERSEMQRDRETIGEKYSEIERREMQRQRRGGGGGEDKERSTT